MSTINNNNNEQKNKKTSNIFNLRNTFYLIILTTLLVCISIYHSYSFKFDSFIYKLNVLYNYKNGYSKNGEDQTNNDTVIDKEFNEMLEKYNNHTKTMNCSNLSQNTKNTRIKINQNVLEIEEIEHLFENKSIKLGGKWSPSECKPLYRVAIIVPYRNREKQLKLFLKHMHPFLMRQQLDYGIYLIEPTGNLTFNRGLLMNIGFTEAINDTNDYWDCYVFHDVDLLPEDDLNYYSCPSMPRHLSSAVSTMGYRLPYETIFGGVTEFTKEQFKSINGFSNYFFGWGGEDDDLYNRVKNKSMNISRYPLNVGRYTMVLHEKEKPSQMRFAILKSGKNRYNTDGLNSLKYIVKRKEKLKLYTRVYVEYSQKEIMKLKISNL